MLSVIVPTYNERENVAELIDRVLAAFACMAEPAELLFVDDDSPDGTADEVRCRAAARGESERIRVLVRRADRGLARAVMAGFSEARGDVLAVIDGDLSHPPELLPDLLRAIRGGADMALGSRYIRGGGTTGWPLSRRLLSRAACMLARGITPVRDATSGYFAVRRTALEGADIRPRGYKIALELLAWLPAGRTVEVPFTFAERRRGTSKLGGAVMAAYLVQLAALYRARFPLLLGYVQFGTVGLAGMLVDAIVFVMAFRLLAGLGTAYHGLAAQTISFVAAAGFNFTLNAAWTFRERSVGARFHHFLAVSAVGFVLRSAVFQAMLSFSLVAQSAGRWPGQELVALACGIVVASAWNYYGSLRWAFRGMPRRELELPHPAVLQSNTWAVAGLACGAVLLIFFAAHTELAFDEAYYWQWSRHLAWGYYDHPPMIAFLIAAGTRLLGQNEIGVRLVPLLVAVSVPWCTWILARRYWQDGVAAAWALAAMICMPLFSVGMVVATPDSPLLAAWALALLATIRALEQGRPGDWMLAGVAVGAGILSKYPMLMMYAVLLGTLLATARGRKALAGPGPWLALAVSLVVTAPLLAWQYAHADAGLLFQLRRGLGPAAGVESTSPIPGFGGLGRFLAGQAAVASPVLFGLALVALGRTAQQWRLSGAPGTEAAAAGKPLTPAELRPLLVLGALVPLVVFAAASMLARSQPNWLAPAYVTAAALLGGELSRMARARTRPWLRRLAWTGIGLAAASSLYVHAELARPLVPYRGGIFTQTYGHAELAAWANRMRDESAGGRRLPILASSYKLASVLAFYLPDHPEVCTPYERASGSAYYAWQPRPEAGTRVLFFGHSALRTEPARLTDLTVLGRHATVRDGTTIRVTWAYTGRARPGACEPPAAPVGSASASP